MNTQIISDRLLLQTYEKTVERLCDRLTFCLKHRGITQTDLARAIGISPQTIQALCSGKIQKSRHLNEIAAHLNIDPIWLATGRSINNSQYLTQIREISQIPIIPWNEIEKPIKSSTHCINGTFDHDNLSYALQIIDDSMSPKFDIGDFLLVSNENIATHGDYVIAKIITNGKYICRIFKQNHLIQLQALNPTYGVINYSDTNFEIIGIVKESRTNLKNA